MKAAVLEKYNQFTVAQKPILQISTDEVLVKVKSGDSIAIRGGGVVCVLGLGDEAVYKELIWKEATIIASRVSHGEFTEAIEQLEKGNLNPDALITTILPIDKIQNAFDLLAQHPDKYLKILLDLND